MATCAWCSSVTTHITLNRKQITERTDWLSSNSYFIFSSYISSILRLRGCWFPSEERCAWLLCECVCASPDVAFIQMQVALNPSRGRIWGAAVLQMRRNHKMTMTKVCAVFSLIEFSFLLAFRSPEPYAAKVEVCPLSFSLSSSLSAVKRQNDIIAALKSSAAAKL